MVVSQFQFFQRLEVFDRRSRYVFQEVVIKINLLQRGNMMHEGMSFYFLNAQAMKIEDLYLKIAILKVEAYHRQTHRNTEYPF